MERPELAVYGVSHATAPLAVREALTLDDAAARRVLSDLRGLFVDVEAFLLSTCNRTELYLVAPSGDPAFDAWHLVVDGASGAVPCADAAAARLVCHGRAAAEHLMRVASGLDSAVLGDVDILGQLRSAVDLARDVGTLGKHLDGTIRRSLSVGKRARATTDISAGGAGVGSAVATLVTRDHRQGQVVLLGAGAAASAIATQLQKRGVDDLVVVNRTLDRATELADRVGGRAGSLGELDRLLSGAEVVVAATRASSPVVTERHLENRPHLRLVVDCGMPRNVAADDPRIVSLDELTDHREGVQELRERAVPAVEALIAEAIDDWEQWFDGLVLDEVIGSLYRDLDGLLDEVRSRVGDDDVANDVQRSVKQVLHAHVNRLREHVTA